MQKNRIAARWGNMIQAVGGISDFPLSFTTTGRSIITPSEAILNPKERTNPMRKSVTDMLIVLLKSAVGMSSSDWSVPAGSGRDPVGSWGIRDESESFGASIENTGSGAVLPVKTRRT